MEYHIPGGFPFAIVVSQLDSFLVTANSGRDTSTAIIVLAQELVCIARHRPAMHFHSITLPGLYRILFHVHIEFATAIFGMFSLIARVVWALLKFERL